MSATFWATAHLAFNDAERAAFEKWRTEMYHTADLLRDRVRLAVIANQPMAQQHADKALELSNDLMSKISQIPSFGP